eukprot:gene1155-1170_t
MTKNWPFHPGSKLPHILTVRWLGQVGDGIFQSSLASFVLFSPERQPNAVSAATAFAVVLLPYSLVALIALLIKAGATGVPLTLLVLVAFGINRLILAGLSAAVTGGSIGVVIGGGIGIGIKKLFDQHGKSDLSDAKIGPAEHEIPTEVRGVRELQEGLRILRNHPDALRGIFSTAIQRGGLTGLTLMGLLLERNTFNPPSNPDAGLAGFAYALAIAGVGFGVGSFITPFFVNYFGRHRWIRVMMIAPFPFLILFAFLPQEWLLLTTAFFIATCGQAVKVTNDALVQSQIADEFRGRVFAFYDVAVRL